MDRSEPPKALPCIPQSFPSSLTGRLTLAYFWSCSGDLASNPSAPTCQPRGCYHIVPHGVRVSRGHRP